MSQQFLNTDVIGEILQFASRSANEAHAYAKVSSNWHSAFLDCESLWIQLVRFRWPQSRLKACTMAVYRARALSDRNLSPISSTSLHEIENCNWDFRCPMFAEALTGTNEVDRVSGMPILFCPVCQEKVYTAPQEKNPIINKEMDAAGTSRYVCCGQCPKRKDETQTIIGTQTTEDTDCNCVAVLSLQGTNNSVKFIQCLKESIEQTSLDCARSLTCRPFFSTQYGPTRYDYVPVTISKDGSTVSIMPNEHPSIQFFHFVLILPEVQAAFPDVQKIARAKTKRIICSSGNKNKLFFLGVEGEDIYPLETAMYSESYHPVKLVHNESLFTAPTTAGGECHKEEEEGENIIRSDDIKDHDEIAQQHYLVTDWLEDTSSTSSSRNSPAEWKPGDFNMDD